METIWLGVLCILTALLFGRIILRGLGRILRITAWVLALGAIFGVGIWGPLAASAVVAVCGLFILATRPASHRYA
jgi:hypothetical protein